MKTLAGFFLEGNLRKLCTFVVKLNHGLWIRKNIKACLTAIQILKG
jgi:hypothetical protein